MQNASPIVLRCVQSSTYSEEGELPGATNTQATPTDEVLFQVESSGENDKPFYIECEAIGEPAPKYYWIKNGKKFEWQTYDDRISQQTGRGTLSISKPSDVDLGQYQCFAENQYGIANIELYGWPKPTVHWMYFYTNGGFKTINSSRMTLDPEGNLCSTSTTKYEYKYGNRVLLNVISSGVSAAQNKREPERQYVTRKNEVAYRGKQSELYCIYGGTMKENTLVKLVTVSGVQIILHQLERVRYVNKSIKSGVLTSSIIAAVPYFIKEPERANKAEDETVEFVCEAGGFPEPAIKWIHNGKPISEAPDNPRREVYKNKIIIRDLVKNDTGNYGCNATNSLGYVYKDVYVNVLSLAPEITEAPRDTQVVDNQDVNMTCKVLGAPNPIIKWIHNGKELTGGRYEIQENGDLLIRSVQFDHKGNYTCYAENKLGNTSASARLDVKRHTYITDGPENYEVEARRPATFRCNAVADETLNLEILWLKDDQPIDFDGEPRFVKTTDYSLTITKTIELDSGLYTCLAKTELDEVAAKAQLTVQDVPNPPSMKSVKCNVKDATISWTPMGDNRSPILYYIIQYNTSFTPEEWKDAYSHVPAAEMTYNIPPQPLGELHFPLCETKPEVPHKNPDNVKGEGDRPDNLVITWTPMPQIEHNAPGFKYRIYWKRDIPGKDYGEPKEIMDYRVDRYVVPNQPSFQQYRIKVVAANEMGDASVSPPEVIGPTTALLSWNPVPLDTVRGHFKGYKIKTWSDTSLNFKEIQVQEETRRLWSPISTLTLKTTLKCTFSITSTMVLPSETLSFDTPEGKPGEMQDLEAIPLGSSAFLLLWEKPDKPNGILTGYNIYYAEVDSSLKVDQQVPRNPQIKDPNKKSAKLGGLKPGTKYRIYISANTSVGESPQKFFIERQTKPVGLYPPSPPRFEYDVKKVGQTASVIVHWLPSQSGNPGSQFFVKYRKKGQSEYLKTEHEKNEDFLVVSGLEPATAYEFIVTSVDGDHYADSDPQEVNTYDVDGPTIKVSENVATAGWFIGMMLAIAFLLLLLIIVCIFKRNRGGKYAVHEREQANGRHDYPDEGGFHEYSQPLDNKSHGRASMGSEPKIGPESDTDSMAEYGDGDTGRFTEDGSFIGQYVPSNMKQLGNSGALQGANNNAMATYV
ncbi:hypothetical protein NQ318_003559 [Aromia moschata]|uniref:Neuroglian n=1 Tax=Aromia moschata TaxID=1265417 RepID=A0AAV8YVE4_9CUCU|nr:hypothetical protein NQ318_003559 [Aromia moschata]